MDTPKLSILTPAIPKRMLQVAELCEALAEQIGQKPVEHLVFIDNKRRSVGFKRDSLLRIARGDYVVFVDDDDEVLPGYVDEILGAIATSPDVVTFNQEAIVNGHRGIVEFKLGNNNDAFIPGGITKRNAWHVCAWRRSLALLSHFPDSSYGEDWAFAAKLCGIAGLKSVHIPKVLHRYVHSSQTTEAPPSLT